MSKHLFHMCGEYITRVINLCFITRGIIKYFWWNKFWYSPSLEYSLIWRGPIAGDRLQILTYARHSWPLSSGGSFACHTYCDTEHPYIMVISENPWHSPTAERLAAEFTTRFNDLSLSNALNNCATTLLSRSIDTFAFGNNK